MAVIVAYRRPCMSFCHACSS